MSTLTSPTEPYEIKALFGELGISAPHLPKSERFRLAKRVEDSPFGFYDLIARATKVRDKRRALLEADLELDRLRLNVRLCVELKLLTPAQYEHAAGVLVEMGKLLGGWLKTVEG